MAAQNAPSEKRTTRRKCESEHIQVSLGCARFFFALSILRSQILFCNRKSKQRLDRHETIVAERCETFRNYCIVGCQDDKCRVETPDEAAGVGGTNPELPQQWPAGAGVVQTRRNQRIHLLPLGTGAVNCCRPSTVLRCAGRDLCGAAETEENVSQRFGTLRHTAYRQCLSGHLPRL